MKALIGLCVLVGSVAGSYIPVLFGADGFSVISILGGIIGAFVGAWVGYRIGSD